MFSSILTANLERWETRFVVKVSYQVIRFRIGAGVRQILGKFAVDGGEPICAINEGGSIKKT